MKERVTMPRNGQEGIMMIRLPEEHIEICEMDGCDIRWKRKPLQQEEIENESNKTRLQRMGQGNGLRAKLPPC